MKRFVLFTALAMCVGGGAFGQTAEKLIAKWKKVQGAEFEEMTERWFDSITVSQASYYNLTDKDFDLMRKSFKKSEQVLFVLDEDRREELERDIQSLKGYETLFVVGDNQESNDSANIQERMWHNAFTLKYKLAMYGKVKGDIVSGFFARFGFGNQVGLARMVCKIPKDFLFKMIQDGTSFFNDNLIDSDNEESFPANMIKTQEAVKNGNVLFVIHGEEHPEFRSTEEVKEYIIANNIYWTHVSWFLGRGLKEKYPHTDRKVVIEFTDRTEDAE
ncbi:MAG: hypothetical protein K2H04_04715 [Bacteroidaceae bacterium]|nr:hypothetical protein [Bacteroidaceae bacterium]